MGARRCHRQHRILDASTVRARFLPRMDRDYLRCSSAVFAIFHQIQCRFGLARHYDLPKPADFVPHTPFRMGAVFSQRCSPEGRHDARYLSGCAAVHRATGPRPGDAVFRAWNGDLAATSNRLVVSTK